jgi:hypothetical protein
MHVGYGRRIDVIADGDEPVIAPLSIMVRAVVICVALAQGRVGRERRRVVRASLDARLLRELRGTALLRQLRLFENGSFAIAAPERQRN